LKQAPRAWYSRLCKELELYGFKESEADSSLFKLSVKTGNIYLLVYVDDILIAGADTATVNEMKKKILTSFQGRDMGEVTSLLGINITRNRQTKELKIDQSAMMKDIVDTFELQDAKAKATPLSTGVKLTKTEGEPLDKEKYPYGTVVGKLMFLAVATRPDLAYSVGALTRHACLCVPSACVYVCGQHVPPILVPWAVPWPAWGALVPAFGRAQREHACLCVPSACAHACGQHVPPVLVPWAVPRPAWAALVPAFAGDQREHACERAWKRGPGDQEGCALREGIAPMTRTAAEMPQGGCFDGLPHSPSRIRGSSPCSLFRKCNTLGPKKNAAIHGAIAKNIKSAATSTGPAPSLVLAVKDLCGIKLGLGSSRSVRATAYHKPSCLRPRRASSAAMPGLGCPCALQVQRHNPATMLACVCVPPSMCSCVWTACAPYCLVP
jgi:hypothetical protein